MRISTKAKINHLPKISIGMPVYNGEKFITRAINSLLDQSYKNFELIISDNASSDSTSKICQNYANFDSRIKYIRQQENIGAYKNFKYVLKSAKSKYFMFAAHDDFWEEKYIECNLAVLISKSDYVSSCSKARFVSCDKIISEATGTFEISGNPIERVKKYLKTPSDNTRYYGVFRKEVLDKAYKKKIHLNLHSCDWYHMVITLLEGNHYCLNETLFYREAPEELRYLNSLIKTSSHKIELYFPVLKISMLILKEFDLGDQIRIFPVLLLLNARMFWHNFKLLKKLND